MKNKVIIIVPSLKGGGAERQVVNLLLHLNREKFELRLCLIIRNGSYLDDVKDCVEIYDLITPSEYHILSRNICNPLIRNILPSHLANVFLRLVLTPVIRNLQCVIEKEKPDILISFLWEADILSALALKRCLIKPKWVIGLQTDPIRYVELKFGKLRTAFTKSLYQEASAVAACSRGTAFQAFKILEMSREKVNVIHNGVDIDRIKVLSLEKVESEYINNDGPVIISMGRLVEVKDYPTLFKAFCIVNQKIPSSKLVVLGEGPQRERLQLMLVEAGISGKVNLMGFKRNPFKYLLNGDVFVLSSLYETFGNVIVEAMSLGLPVVATKCNGPEDIIQHGVNGFLVPKENPEAMADSVLSLLDNPELRKRFANEGKRIVEEKFSVFSMVKSYEELFYKSSRRH